jgi:hypothetical protein
MDKAMRLTLAVCALVLGGCAMTPQLPVSLASEAVGPQSGRVGIVMAALPKIEVRVPGADCLLCYAFASSANSALDTHAKTLSYEDLPNLKEEIAKLLGKKGSQVVVIPQALDIEALPNSRGEIANLAKKDFSSLQKKHGIDRLLVINITSLGFLRTYSAYIPTSDPKGSLRGTGFMVNLKSNTYEWYLPVDIARSADRNWDEPPKYPGLTNAYYQALELGKDSFLKPFGN